MVTAVHRMLPPMEYVRLHDEAAGLDGVIAIHSTARGPAAGGCRLWTYPNADAAMADAFRLAEGMSYKNAMAELPFGGGKAVLRKPAGAFDRRALFEAFGAAVERLEGRYVTAEDVGTSVADMEFVANRTKHVAGRTSRPGFAGGDPSPWTALGVFEAMKAAVRFRFGGTLSGVTVAVQGVGSVGGELCRLLADEGARLVIADIDDTRCARLAEDLGVRVAPIAEIAEVEAEVFAPCALGGALSEASVSALRASLVCGAANNQLADPSVAQMLLDRGIAYAPDYVVNAGGIINVAAEYLGESSDDVRARVLRIGPRTADVLDRASQEGLPPSVVADRMAEHLMRRPVAEPA
ncbi:Leu/Phe/Val dehydrogenase [Novosphingobium mangrovi (ex Huang et al. 2023)]|uniref:Amino acid dehydrogenase n=1 Tax=Novosphingobium mangrovi (ex Huang et al. 2023) TaxID=2976432 RepID=A0ABT2I2G0_9SPHN|nr:Glu/Leu/Phe/Val dehydrogenase dimerization domain-containing protein [Novosphingobium mangrovi (ex Huang et al. 2023)]MCT2398989.1 amino acid dehydrogenase [Novosphingobium mangrovi (ex Huang et al. 2023)]